MAARGQNHGKGKNKKAYAPKPKISPPPKREDPAKDSICHECGLKASRKLKPMALSLYVGNGQHEAVEAIGVFNLCLPSGLEIVLNNCHYAPSITRGVIHISKKCIKKLQHDGLLDSSDLKAFEKCVY
nr:zinc finger, CCHC-type [Tanacetum cinerariifolium]